MLWNAYLAAIVKALFVSVYSDTPHFETELELMAEHRDQGHEVHVLRCTGQLGACLKNPEHKLGVCRVCVSKIDQGLRTIEGVQIHVMPVVRPDARLPELFASVDELKTYTLDGAELGRGVYATVCSRADKDPQFDPRRYATLIRRELESAFAMYTALRQTIARVRPDRVYIFNGRFSTCHSAIEACRLEGVTYVTHERGGTRDHYFVRQDSLPHDIAPNQEDIVRCWGDGGPEKEAIARTWYLQRREGNERNWLSYVGEQSVGLLPPGFDPKKRNIAVFNSSLEEYASIKSWESPFYPDEVVGTKMIIESLRSRPDTHLYLRVHPHLKNLRREDNYQLRAYAELERTQKHVTVIWPESPVHTYELVDRANVVVTFGSTVGAEACFWGTPSVLAGHATYEDCDCAYRPKSHDEVMQLLLGDTAAKPQIGALKYGYWESVRGILFKRFRATSLYTGYWRGRRLGPSLVARAQNVLLSRILRQ
jgi:hypothetical protein